jgi:catechol 2,3-dioxygenase-like lactoylglutathione lyase family enzyme
VGYCATDRQKNVLMRQNIGYVALLVRDYDEAIHYFTHVLRFALVEDTRLTDDKRWVVVAPPGSSGTSLVLAKAVTADQVAQIGNQASGRVFLFLHTDDFWRDYHDMRARGVVFREAPRQESYGTVAVFADLYGNRWDLLQLES